MKLGLGAKLIGLITVLLVTALVTLTAISVYLFREDNLLLVQQLNTHQARSLASETRETFDKILQKSQLIGNMISQRSENPSVALTKHPEFLGLLRINSASPMLNLNTVVYGPNSALQTREDPMAMGRKHLLALTPLAQRALAGEAQVTMVNLEELGTVLLMAVPFKNTDGPPKAVLAILDAALVLQTFRQNDGVTSYLVDADGILLAHSDKSIDKIGIKGDLPELLELLQDPVNNTQLTYVDPATKQERMAAFRKVGFAGLATVAEVPRDIALESSRRVIKIASLVAFVIFWVVLFIGSLYSGLMVLPLLRLKDAAQKIWEGNLGARALDSDSGDEIGELSRTFNQMAQGLEERAKYQEIFTKFHSPELAEKLLSGEVKLGGEKREAVILFTDLRGFTTLSETLEPEQVVELLNEFMSSMVTIIQNRGGVIDKFIGDAILATWGIPYPTPGDKSNALAACLEMRAELEFLNAKRTKEAKPTFCMGMGLNLGNVIAGNIGSQKRMEYTVIGDAVNIASRLQSATKTLNTDLLVSESLARHLADEFAFEPSGNLMLKGKTQAIKVYKVPDSKQVKKAA